MNTASRLEVLTKDCGAQRRNRFVVLFGTPGRDTWPHVGEGDSRDRGRGDNSVHRLGPKLEAVAGPKNRKQKGRVTATGNRALSLPIYWLFLRFHLDLGDFWFRLLRLGKLDLEHAVIERSRDFFDIDR